MLTGGCHCGAIRYEIDGEPINHKLCHCTDCQRASGAPLVGWVMVPVEAIGFTGEPAVYASSEHGRRHFCIQCGTSLFYANNDMQPGMVDVASGTLDEPGSCPPEAQVQTADRIGWMKDAHALPEFERF